MNANQLMLPLRQSRKNISLSTLLASLQAEAGISSSALASRANISRTTLHNWQSGKTIPRIHELSNLLSVCGASESVIHSAISLIDAPRGRKSEKDFLDELPCAPHGGDLLKSLRFRCRMTQGEVAAQVGVRQPTLARWESGTAWPEETVLIKTCDVLKAHAEEKRCIISSRFGLNLWSNEVCDPVLLEEAIESRLRWILSVRDLPEHFPLQDLYFMSLTAMAVELVRLNPETRQILIKVLNYHSIYLGQIQMHSEAARISNRILDIHPLEGRKLTDAQANSTILSIRGTVFNKDQLNLRSALSQLKQIEDEPMTASQRSRYMSELSFYLSKAGESESAVRCSRESVKFSRESGSQVEITRRTNEAAWRFLSAGMPEEAIKVNAEADLGGLTVFDHVSIDICNAKASMKTDQKSDAHFWLTNALDKLKTNPIREFEREANQLANQL